LGALESRTAQVQCKVLLFTMQTLESYDGGAMGELIVLDCLDNALKKLGCETIRVLNDPQLELILANEATEFSHFIFDEFTFLAPKRVRVLQKELENKWYILDFFGHSKPHKELNGRGMASDYYTAFRNGERYGNTFLGFYVDTPIQGIAKKRQGIIWGKRPKYLKNHDFFLRKIADEVNLISTVSQSLIPHHGINFIGKQSKHDWFRLLAESQFILGLGDPVMGPTGVEAMAQGCVYINPRELRIINENSDRIEIKSQHDPMADIANTENKEKYVCEYSKGNVAEALSCIRNIKGNLVPYIPKDFRNENHMQRVKTIFGLYSF